MVKEKFGGSAALLGLHDRIADVLLTATALSAESPGMLGLLCTFLARSTFLEYSILHCSHHHCRKGDLVIQAFSAAEC